MKIENVKLRGFIGIKKGLGLDEIALDLSGLSGLIALAGPNGKGKSTLLENLSPFRTLASRKGSLQHHVFLRDSQKDLSFRWNEDLYETTVKIDSQSGRGEAFIYKNGRPEIKGRSSEYDRYMKDLLGSEELFFASVFCAQGSDKLSDMTTGQLKALFSEFLRLDLLIQHEDTSKRCAVTLLGQAKALDGEGSYLEAETAKKADLLKELPEKQTAIYYKAETVQSMNAQIMLSEKALKDLRQRVEDNRVHEARLKDFQAQGAKMTADWKRDKETGERSIADLKEKAQKVEVAIAETSRVIARKEEIEAAVVEENRLSERLGSVTLEYNEVTDEQKEVISALGKNGRIQADLGAEIRALGNDSQLQALESSLKSARQRKALMDKRDPACISTTCAFILDSLKADGEIPAMEGAIADRRKLVSGQVNQKMMLLNGIEELLTSDRKREAELSERWKALYNSVKIIKEGIKVVKPLVDLKSPLDTATAKLEGLRTREAEIKNNIAAVIEANLTKKDDYELLLIGNTKSIREVQALVDPLVTEDLEQAEAELKTLTASKEMTEKEISSLRADLAGLEVQIKACEEKESRLTVIQEKRRIILVEASDWEYLKNACSKDGLRALEIDSVAPTISAYANDLLSRTFGPLFQVRFRTQNDEGREVLDILAIREDGTEALIENLSGGERVWILKALRLAMTLVSKEKSGRALGTAFADEEDGALDVENGQNFIQLYRSFLSAGGFESLYYISHKPACVDMADHVLRFDGKGIEVQ